jgi:hypothetical protein
MCSYVLAFILHPGFRDWQQQLNCFWLLSDTRCVESSEANLHITMGNGEDIVRALSSSTPLHWLRVIQVYAKEAPCRTPVQTLLETPVINL